MPHLHLRKRQGRRRQVGITALALVAVVANLAGVPAAMERAFLPVELFFREPASAFGCRYQNHAERDVRPARSAAERCGPALKAVAEAAQALEAPVTDGTTESAFDWQKQWYPVSPVSYLDKGRATAVQVLGFRLAVWPHADGTWSCFEDVCPHRLAPLSTGKVCEDGTLMCRYHGWQFSSDGKCQRIPMATSEKAEDRARRVLRTAAASCPTRTAGGLLWVWPDFSPDAWSQSAASSAPPAFTELENATWTFQLQPLSYESLVENCLDPSHAPFLHEGLRGQGMKEQSPNDATPMLQYDLEGEVHAAGFALQHSPYTKGSTAACVRRFVAPSTVDASVQLPAFTFRAVLYFVPAGPRETRVIFHFPGYEPDAPGWTRFFPACFRKDVKAIRHARHCVGDVGYWRFNDQDRIAMEGQDRARQDNLRGQAVDLALTPSDKGVATFQRWLRDFAAGGPFSPLARHQRDRSAGGPGVAGDHGGNGSLMPGPSPDGPVDAPRWRLHCGHCPQCRRALAVLDTARRRTAASAGAFIVAAGIAGLAGCFRCASMAGAIGVLLRWASQVAGRWRLLFFRSDPLERTSEVYCRK